jgi:SAM-dependent methyltransferase
MKPSALDVIVCPGCRHELRLHADRWERDEVLDGTLACGGCGAAYAIANAIPRFVPADAYARSFGRQWHWFRTVQLDSCRATAASERALRATTGWADDEYRGRRLLDAGVGAGRFAERAAVKGADVFGVDLTTAVDAARHNLGHLPNVHLLQADIFALPFRPATFDLAYAIGVLHHTPDPPAAFDRVAASVKPGGKLAIYVYARYGPTHRVSDALRVLTTRLPLRVMWMCAAAAIPLYYLYRVPVLGRVLRLAVPISLDPDWRTRWLDTFDWYTPTYQHKYLYPEVFRWFRTNGFTDIELFDDPIRLCGTKQPARESARVGADAASSLVAV